DGGAGEHGRDEFEASALYDLLESKVVPLFYGDPAGWLSMVRAVLRKLRPVVLADRMVTDYVGSLYRPAADAGRRLANDDYARARQLAGWLSRVRAAWPDVRLRSLRILTEDSAIVRGSDIMLRADVELGMLSPTDVDVQAFAGPLAGNALIEPSCTSMVCVDDRGRYEVAIPLGRGGAFGYTVRVLPRHDLLGSTELGLVRHVESDRVTEEMA
ncbi:MAG: DUF3417 domain-containing protein, partial [Haloechinothrix sp.]